MGVTKYTMVDLIRNNEDEEFVCYFPEWKDLATAMSEKYEKFVAKIEKLFLDSADMTPKDFASM